MKTIGVFLKIITFSIIICVLYSCHCDDCGHYEKPVITLKGSKDTLLVYNDLWIDPGYIAMDNIDGDITRNVVVSGSVNNDSAGLYTLHYIVKASSGLLSTPVSRNVTIDAAPFLAVKYNVIVTSNNNTITYTDSVFVSNGIVNRIVFGRFGSNQNCFVFANLAGRTIDIPKQIVITDFPIGIEHTFQGNGTFTNTNKIDIIYSDSSSLGKFSNCIAKYTKYN